MGNRMKQSNRVLKGQDKSLEDELSLKSNLVTNAHEGNFSMLAGQIQNATSEQKNIMKPSSNDSNFISNSRVLRIRLEKPLFLAPEQIEREQFMTGNISSVPFDSVGPIIDGISYMVEQIACLKPEQVVRVQAVPVNGLAGTAEIHLVIPRPVEPSIIQKNTLAIRIYFSHLKRFQETELSLDMEGFELDSSVMELARVQATKTGSLLGGRLPCALTVMGGLVLGELGLAGPLVQEELEEVEGDPIELDGIWDGFWASKRKAFFVTQLVEKKDRTSVEIHFEGGKWSQEIAKLPHGRNCLARVSVTEVTKGKKEWYKLNKIIDSGLLNGDCPAKPNQQ